LQKFLGKKKSRPGKRSGKFLHISPAGMNEPDSRGQVPSAGFLRTTISHGTRMSLRYGVSQNGPGGQRSPMKVSGMGLFQDRPYQVVEALIHEKEALIHGFSAFFRWRKWDANSNNRRRDRFRDHTPVAKNDCNPAIARKMKNPPTVTDVI